MDTLRLPARIKFPAVVAVGLIWLLVSAGCGGPTSVVSAPCTVQQITISGKGGIAGSVILLNGYAAIGASVALDLTPVATTDGNGRFCLVNLAPKQYSISANSSNQSSAGKSVVVLNNSITSITIQFNSTAMPYYATGGPGVARLATTPQPPAAPGEGR